VPDLEKYRSGNPGSKGNRTRPGEYRNEGLPRAAADIRVCEFSVIAVVQLRRPAIEYPTGRKISACSRCRVNVQVQVSSRFIRREQKWHRLKTVKSDVLSYIFLRFPAPGRRDAKWWNQGPFDMTILI
jgi:hypothetical protein